ncbi:hypothetical protein E3N88_05745 [Mikania micrantha]|uniref:Uncharacterized protein n=1 Tax=Mikania micrantha TaxID=192012 RepID=A0A5N6PPS3_9ASTR|nr:hypothetical protein E3N88_05745 [Mikania micrantha]
MTSNSNLRAGSQGGRRVRRLTKEEDERIMATGVASGVTESMGVVAQALSDEPMSVGKRNTEDRRERLRVWVWALAMGRLEEEDRRWFFIFV